MKQFDLKTITGKNSVGNRLKESLGQTERVLLNMRTDYNIRHLTLEIKRYFEMSADVQEVLIYSGSKDDFMTEVEDDTIAYSIRRCLTLRVTAT